MKLTREDLYYCLTEIHFNELNSIRAALRSFIRLADKTELESVTDSQEKDKHLEELKKVIGILDSIGSTKTAESWEEAIYRKVIEKHVDDN